MAEYRFSVSRIATLWLFAVQIMVLIPVIDVVPLPVIFLAVVAFIWRLLIWFGRGIWPPLWIRLIMVFLTIATVMITFSRVAILESAVTILVAGYSMKLLEMRSRRDALVVVFIGFFVVATGVLYSQSLLQGIYLLLCLVVLIGSLQTIYRPVDSQPLMKALRFSCVLVLQALPLTIVLFLFIPRINPLWTVPLPDHSAKTGLSDQMNPGDIAKLSQSDELAFRARFKGAIPPPTERYWRAVIMDRYDDGLWQQTNYSGLSRRYPAVPIQQKDWQTSDPESAGWWLTAQPDYDYEIMMEPHGRPWLITLGQAGGVIDNSIAFRTMRLEAVKPVNERKLYFPEEGKPVPESVVMPSWLTALNTDLPAGSNPRSRTLAKRLLSENNNDPIKMAGAIMAMLHQEAFYYTLSPALLGDNEIDDFLFKERRGFCEHYASAFTFMMRAAGVPARVVAGYQGGELKTDESVIQVRQFDAHAWSEIWVENRGWLRFDPTAAVSPERIGSGLDEALRGEGGFLASRPLSLYKYKNVALINRLRLAYERVEYNWQRSVINYQQEQQEKFLQNLFGSKTVYWQQVTVLGVLFFLITGFLAVFMFYRRQKVDYLTRMWRKFERKLAKHNFIREHGEGPEDFAKRVCSEAPSLTVPVMGFIEVFIKLGFDQKTTKRSDDLVMWLKRL